MNKELELEAEKLYPVKKTGSMFMANREEINNYYKQEGFIAGASSHYVEKQKLEFAIEQLRKCTHAPTIRVGVVLEELEQKLSEL
jgi:hypothetical protein